MEVRAGHHGWPGRLSTSGVDARIPAALARSARRPPQFSDDGRPSLTNQHIVNRKQIAAGVDPDDRGAGSKTLNAIASHRLSTVAVLDRQSTEQRESGFTIRH